MPFHKLTGNPFVDTGLYVLSSLAKTDDPNELSTDDVHVVFGDGSNLAQINARLRSFTMVFGANGPLTQSQYRPKGKQKQLSEKNVKAYTGVLSAFLRQTEQSASEFPLCEVCGENHGFDFDSVVRQALIQAGVTDRGIKQIGRDWFPLAGSPGNDAQALPSASRGLSICAKCLFVVHYMPLGLMLMQGRLVCFQSRPSSIAAELVANIVYDYENKLHATNDKIEMLGKKEGTTSMTRRLLSWMSKLQQTKKEETLPDSVTLLLWLFSNAGADADCEITEIPNHALQFLWQARKLGFSNELLTLLQSESKVPDYQLLSCVQNHRDYTRLYPYKTFQGASPGLFALYHQLVLGETITALQSAQRLAQARLAEVKPKDQKALKKAGVLENSQEERNRIRRLILDMGRDGNFSPADYDALFPTVQHHPIRVDFRGWKTIGYFFSNASGDLRDFSSLAISQGEDMKVHPKIKEAAKFYFDDYLTRRTPKDFENRILDNFTRTNPNGVQWLRDLFCRLAKEYPGFTYGDWDEFVLDENGRPQTFELLFQMRLELANLYREHNQNPSTSIL